MHFIGMMEIFGFGKVGGDGRLGGVEYSLIGSTLRRCPVRVRLPSLPNYSLAISPCAKTRLKYFTIALNKPISFESLLRQFE